jgi:hypothetical protein
MTRTDGISNRHLLQAEGLAEKPLHLAQQIRIVVSDEWASSRAGQLLASCLVNLLARQVGLVSVIEILAPAVPTIIRQPDGTMSDTPLPRSLSLISAWAVDGGVSILTPSEPAINPDITILIGDRSPVHTGIALFTVGDGWRAWVGDVERAPVGIVPKSSNPLGPFLAAALAAGEVFKRGRGLLRGRLLTADGYSLWSGEQAPQWESLEDGPELIGRRLTPLHVFGAGAVGNGVAYVLANAELGETYSIIVDDDTYDDTSLNRCLLAGYADVKDPKVDAIAQVLTRSGAGVFKFRGTVSQYLADDRSGLRADIAEQVDELIFETVVSCVDRGVSRQDIQGLAPSTLFGGSTLGLAARANFYANRPGAACLSCFNPPERDGGRLRVLEKLLRDFGVEERAAFLRKEGIEPEVVEAYLASPECGTLGEAALRDLATRAPSQFSVGFVSLGAALLLAAKIFQIALYSRVPNRGDVSSLNFRNGGFGDSFLGPDDACVWGCQTKRSAVPA